MAHPDVQTTALFQVPSWTATMVDPARLVPSLVRDIEALLATSAQDFMRSSGNQTLPDLQERREPHWVEFIAWVTSVFVTIAATAPVQRYRNFEVRAWGLRIESAASSDKDLHHGPTRTLVTHNHAPALLTSVFTCELPAEPPPDRLSTIFHNPVVNVNCPWQPRIAPVVPEVGRLMVFPGWLEHSVPVVAPIPPGQQRITINTDYFPDFR